MTAKMKRRAFITLLGGAVAIHGARAAGKEATDHRVPWYECFGMGTMDRRVRAADE